MITPDIAGIAPFFIVKNVPAALSFYRDRLGFDITFQGPDPDDISFGIDPHAGHGTIGYGGVEWVRAGRGMWHGKELSAGTSPTAQGFQL